MKIEITGEGAITKDGESIGKYIADANIVLSDRQLTPPERKAIAKEIGGEVEPVFDVAPQNENAGLAVESDEQEKPAKPKAAPKGDGKTLAERYPDAPPIDPAAGDKTPAFVAWLEKNHPKDAEARYRGRKVGGVLR